MRVGIFLRPTVSIYGIAFILLLTAVSPAHSQVPQDTNLQILRNKVQQLEQEVQELKEAINAAEKARLSTPVPVPTPAPSITTAAPSQQAPSTAAPAGDEAKSVQKDKSEGTIDLYGFLMADSGYDFKTNDPNWFDVVRPVKLPAFAGEFAPNGKVYFSVRQTRFGVKTSTPTKLGNLDTKFEFELFGTGVDAGQTTFRLRHAYGQLGQFLAGQTWSPFMDIDAFPNSLEYWGPNAMVFFRNIQLRWTPIQTKRTELALAIERPGASADQGVYRDRIELQGIQPRFNLPDFSGHVRFTRSWGYAQFGGIARKIGWVDTNNDALNLSGTAFGWGVNVTSNLNMTKKNVGKFQFVYGDGIENYMNDAPVDIGIKNNFSNPVTPVKGVALPLLGVVGFLDHTWSDRFTSSLGYSFLNIDNSDAQLPSDFHQGGYALANLLFKPVPRVTTGSEFLFGRRVNNSDGFNTNDYRLQFSFKFDWSKTWVY